MEEVTLSQVEQNGVLVLEDGRRLIVYPADFTMSILWLPTSTLEVLETEEGMFDLSVTIQGTTQQIRAKWKSGQGAAPDIPVLDITG